MAQLSAVGVAIWLDDLSRDRLHTGNLKSMIENKHVVGVTTNPSIFQTAISKSSLYDDHIRAAAETGEDAHGAVRRFTTDDVRNAADLFTAVAEQSGNGDGRVSIEVDPRLAHDTDATISQAQDLWTEIGRPNIYVKIPATTLSLPAITAASPSRPYEAGGARHDRAVSVLRLRRVGQWRTCARTSRKADNRW
ncbi:transaldolase family protein [Jiangella asiatica]|uniref:transaldolase family protein n=1 Tax=Jiangella asiatica TaxID=2530372 RepID=UPI001EF1573E|nr:transaldolase family protein [Jiangella asiatica]